MKDVRKDNHLKDIHWNTAIILKTGNTLNISLIKNLSSTLIQWNTIQSLKIIWKKCVHWCGTIFIIDTILCMYVYLYAHVCVHTYTYIQKKIDSENTSCEWLSLGWWNNVCWGLLLLFLLLLFLPLSLPLLLLLICIFHHNPSLLL